MHSYSTALEAAGGYPAPPEGSVYGHRAGQALPAAPFPLDNNVLSFLWSLKFGAFQRCARHMEASTAPFLFYLERLTLMMTSVPGEPALPEGTSDLILCADVTSN